MLLYSFGVILFERIFIIISAFLCTSVTDQLNNNNINNMSNNNNKETTTTEKCFYFKGIVVKAIKILQTLFRTIFSFLKIFRRIMLENIQKMCKVIKMQKSFF